MSLHRICYKGKIDWAQLTQSLPEEIDHTLARIHRINRRAGVTGALFLGDQHVVQLLEGDTDAVVETFDCVAQDRRVVNTQILLHEPARQRLFPNNLMFFRDLTDGVAATRNELLKPMLEDAANITGGTALTALKHFAEDLRQSRLTNDLLMV